MYRLAVPAIALLGVIPGWTEDAKAAEGREDASRQELQRIQGAWQVVSQEENGAKAAADSLRDRIIFFGGDAFLVKQGHNLLQMGTQKLDPSKSPKTINVMVTQGDRRGDVWLGIYELQGDTLKVCFDPDAQKRPTEFKSERGSGLVLVVYKRQGAVGDAEPDITGEYVSQSTEIDGSKHTTDVEIERRGDAYLLTYKKNNVVAYVGMGIRREDALSVCWATQGQAGIAVYQIEKDGRLVGHYATLQSIGLLAEETLTPRTQD